MKRAGHIFIIVAPSGTGKSTLIERLVAEVNELQWSVSCTTRPIRKGEVDGENYFFLERKKFENLIKDNAFVEWAHVHENYYGTSRDFVENGLSSGKMLLFDVDVQGADALKRNYPKDSTAIFIEPPSYDELEKRLRGRGTDAPEVIEVRLANAKKELLRKKDYDKLVMNDQIERAFSELKSIIEGEIACNSN